MQIKQYDASEYEQDSANDDLNRIVQVKEELTDLVDRIHKIVGYAPKRYFSPNFDEFTAFANTVEEGFDDLLHGEWYRLAAISQSVEWTSAIPSCDSLRANMARKERERRRHTIRPVPTNPATTGAL